MIPSVSISLLSVFVAAIILFFLGWFWYSSFLFGKPWMRLMKIDPKKIKSTKSRGMILTMLTSFAAYFIMSYVLAHFVAYTTASSFLEGMQVGFWLWLGFVVPVSLASVLWEQKPQGLFFINTGCYLVSLLLAGGLLAIW